LFYVFPVLTASQVLPFLLYFKFAVLCRPRSRQLAANGEAAWQQWRGTQILMRVDILQVFTKTFCGVTPAIAPNRLLYAVISVAFKVF